MAKRYKVIIQDDEELGDEKELCETLIVNVCDIGLTIESVEEIKEEEKIVAGIIERAGREDEADKAILEVIYERDHFEDVLTECAEAAGCQEEWSNLHEHGDCIINELHRQRAGGETKI